MASRKELTRGQVEIVLEISPDPVDAGAEIVLHARVSFSPPGDPSGHTLLVKDEAGAELGVLELTESDDEEAAAGEAVLKAPLTVRDHVWSVLSPTLVKKSVSYEEVSQAISFAVRPHTIRVLAWDAPPTVVAGDRFKINVGIKCSSECSFAHEAFEVCDHASAAIAAGMVSSSIWPGTSGLYSAAIELEAPSTAGLYYWTIKCAGQDLEKPHVEGAAQFSVQVVPAPDCLLRVQAVDRESQAPLADARIALHPYKAVTDERGLAEIRVAKGAYDLFVAKANYLTLGLPVDVMADMTAKAELDPEPLIERN
jgi:hypothetical protein